MIPLQQGFSLDPQSLLNQYGPALINAAVTIVLFLVSFVIIYYVGKAIVVRMLNAALNSRDVDETIAGLVVSTVVAIMAVLAIVIAATIAGAGVVLAAFATLAGALALAVGFAAQDLISNFVAGIFIIQDEPFKVGDWIEWDGNVGVVREIQLRVTKLDTFDNEEVTVPNSDLASAVVTNPTGNDQLRVGVDFGIEYDDDIEAARAAILDEARKLDGALTEPEPAAPVTSLGDSAVVLSGRVWINPNETGYAPTAATFTEAVKKRFDAEGIGMPYPYTELTGSVDVESPDEAGYTATND
ncbi:mechanosensitive ion channel family protein [Halococcus salifodinae]|uniref:Putative mechanosensitive ion channel n=1 Tax=Halococcus salifodinae DSM 8989 TaxID=1227456 RepID=M0MQH6_9EURY|nr:mechanosensitive ion channel family protein [Halococcus salifodinae]EMA47578.1 putative mechanosensitive ion channel [Halococcus salifodinae DSM 8989]